MDEYDLKLINQLQKHADIALTELSRRLGMSKTTCWNRLQRLEEQGVIEENTPNSIVSSSVCQLSYFCQSQLGDIRLNGVASLRQLLNAFLRLLKCTTDW